MCTRLLFTVLPSPYSKKSFNHLLSILAEDLKFMEDQGIKVSYLHIRQLDIMIVDVENVSTWTSPINMKCHKTIISTRILKGYGYHQVLIQVWYSRLNGKENPFTSGSSSRERKVTGHFSAQRIH